MGLRQRLGRSVTANILHGGGCATPRRVGQYRRVLSARAGDPGRPTHRPRRGQPHDGRSLVELVPRMEDDRGCIIQTVPRLRRGADAIAQLQRFGPRFTAPRSPPVWRRWTGGKATTGDTTTSYVAAPSWRRRACLSLPGKPPLGGFILSHDFVEAALLRRAGWTVVMPTTLQAGRRSSPATLIELALRDRRWCQGNLQRARDPRPRASVR